MKKSLIAIALVALCVPMFAGQNGQTPAPEKTKTSKPKKHKSSKKSSKKSDSTTTPSK